MDPPHQLNWMTYDLSQQSKMPRIKDEPVDFNLIHPNPSVPPPSFPAPSSSLSRRSSTPSAPKRQRPYPSLTPDLPNRRPPSDSTPTMSSSSHPYGTWSSLRNGSGRPHSLSRRSTGEEPFATTTLNSYMSVRDRFFPRTRAAQRLTKIFHLQEPYGIVSMTASADPSEQLRPASSSSSLTGAMGEANISVHSRSSRSPPNGIYTASLPSQDLSWPNQQMNLAMGTGSTPYPGHTSATMSFNNIGHGHASPAVMPSFDDYAAHRNPSPESLAPPSPPYPHSSQFSEQQQQQYNRAQLSIGSSRSSTSTYGTATSFPGAPSQDAMSVDSVPSAEQEIRRLRRRVHELELELQRTRALASSTSSAQPSGLPTPPHSSSFQAGWKARTEARKKIFCSLNRAGNALCAWHDSRRERRKYAPRNAPPGVLNCGCTHEQALFEESLARHGVGSYLPGDRVRMDPSLRNPLLALLQRRYGYKDGDFEHDPLTEEWAEGESPAAWEQKAHSGQIVKRRTDGGKEAGSSEPMM